MSMCDCYNSCVPLLNASNYTQLKRNRILYKEYKANYPRASVCTQMTTDQKNKYISYHMKQSIEKGCWHDEYYCSCQCLSTHKKRKVYHCNTCDVVFPHVI